MKKFKLTRRNFLKWGLRCSVCAALGYPTLVEPNWPIFKEAEVPIQGLPKNLDGLKVGLLDLDIFGPSLPKLLGIEGESPSLSDNKKIKPIEALGLKVMSIGLLIKNDDPIVWRGPRVMGATSQLLKDVDWGELDVMVLDLPPGTGDVQLSLIQTVPVSGAIIVSTPQDLALIDARKGLMMFEKTNVDVLGIVENMSSFSCPKCGEESHIFGHGGAADTAKDLGVDFLGEVPLHMDIRELSDAGTPIVSIKPDSPQAFAYKAIADKIKEKLPSVLA